MLSIEEFGEVLLKTGDLDPVYTALMAVNSALRPRTCVAYWCYYNLNTALEIAESSDYWACFKQAARNDRTVKVWPRGTERRHYRGLMALTSATELAIRYPTPEDMVSYLTEGSLDWREVFRRVQIHYGFGLWISFKVADMLERVLGYSVSFKDCDLAIYKDPVKGAKLACEAWGVTPERPVAYALERLTDHFAGYRAPPTFDRPIGLQEAETILCKWKSHVGGHYPVGKDLAELRHTLTGRPELVACLN